jgi:hypothetical protein
MIYRCFGDGGLRVAERVGTLAAATAKQRVVCLLVIFVAVTSSGLVCAGDPPESKAVAMQIASNLFVPLSAELTPSANRDRALSMDTSESHLLVETSRERKGLLGRLLSSDPYRYKLTVTFRSIYQGRIIDGIHSVVWLNPKKPSHKILIDITRQTLDFPHSIPHWRLHFWDSDEGRELTLRKWRVRLASPFITAADIEGVVAELEATNDAGDVALLRVPLKESMLSEQAVFAESTEAEWINQVRWQPIDSATADALAVSPFVRVQVHHPASYTRNPAVSFDGFDEHWLEPALVQMEKETYEWNAWEAQQIRHLLTDPSVFVVIAKANTEVNYNPQTVGYLVYRLGEDYIEILAMGCHPAYQDLGVQQQLLSDLKHGLNPERPYLLARLPKFQHPQLVHAGFSPWPKGNSFVPLLLGDLHRGNAMRGEVAKPLLGEASAPQSVDSKNAFYLGKLPEPPNHVSTDANESSQETALSFEPPREWTGGDANATDSVDSFFDSYSTFTLDPNAEKSESPQSSSEGSASQSDSSGPNKDSARELALYPIQFLTLQLAMLARVRGAVTDAEKSAAKAEVLHHFDLRQIESTMGCRYNAGIPFEVLAPFLEKKVFQYAGGKLMAGAVKLLLTEYLQTADQFWNTQPRDKLVHTMNFLSSIRRPDLGPMSVSEAVRLAKIFVRKEAFPVNRFVTRGDWNSTPRWQPSQLAMDLFYPYFDEVSEGPTQEGVFGHVRKNIISLKPLNVPPQLEHAEITKAVRHVLMLHQNSDHRLSVEPGHLLPSDLPNVHKDPKLKNMLWIDSAFAMTHYIDVQNLEASHWTLEYLRKQKPLRIIPGQALLAGVSHLPAPTAPLYLGYWLLDGTQNHVSIYMVLVSRDPQWNHQVVDAHFLEPSHPFLLDLADKAEADKAAADTDFKFAREADCSSVILNANRTIRAHRYN